jgi:hypothetical protein
MTARTVPDSPESVKMDAAWSGRLMPMTIKRGRKTAKEKRKDPAPMWKGNLLALEIYLDWEDAGLLPLKRKRPVRAIRHTDAP